MNSENKTSGTPSPGRKRRKKAVRRKRNEKSQHGKEAVRTLVSIMKNEDHPRLQIAAAKALLLRKDAVAAVETPPEVVKEGAGDDIDTILALAKTLLDECAALKSGGVPGEGRMAETGPAVPDHTAV